MLLSEDDLDAIRALDGVEDVEGSTETIAWLPYADGKLEVSVLTMAQRISRPEILEGRAPETANECMLENGLAKKLGLQIGDQITLEGRGSGSVPPLLKETAFTVSGIFSHPDHVTDKVSYSFYIITDKEAFDNELLEGCFPRVRVKLADMPDNYFSKDYMKRVKPAEEALKELSKLRSPLRDAQVRETYEQKIADGEAQLDEAKATLEDAERKLRDGEAQLEDAEAQIADGEAQLEDAEAKLEDYDAQFKDAEAQLKDYDAQFKDAEAKLKDYDARFKDGEARFKDGEARLKDGEARLKDGEARFKDGEARLEDYEAQFKDAEAQLAEYDRQIAEYDELIRDGERQIRDAEEQIRDGRKQIAEGEAKLQKAEEDNAESIQKYEEGKKQLAEAERLLGLAPGQLTAGAARLRDAETELAEGKATLDQAQAKLQAVDTLINQGYDWVAGHAPSPEDIARIKVEIAERFNVDTSFIPDTIPEEFFNSSREEVVQWIKDHVGVTNMEEEYEAGLERYKAGLSEYERGRLDYYYGGEQYLDGLASYKKGKKAIEEAEVKLQELYNARDLLNEKKEELAAGQRKLEEKRAELEDGKRELEEKRTELNNGHRELEEKCTELENGRRELEDARRELEDGKRELEEKRAELEDARRELEEKRAELEDARRELEEKRIELEDGHRELEEKRIELEDGHRELEEKRAELEDGKRKAAEGRAELEEKRREYDEGLQKYEEYRTMLDNARAQLAQLENGAWIVRNNRGDICFIYSGENSSNLASLSGTFSLLFIVIAALVIYASVGRMVDEQSVLVGTTKALGLLRREILLKYMIFGVLGTMLGVLLGTLLAYFVLEPLILNMYAPYYLVPKAKPCFLIGPTLIVVLGGLLLAFLSVYFASNRLLKMTAVQLMNGTGTEQKKEKEDKKKAKKKANDGEGSMMPGLILRNMSTDPKRVIVTIVSIMGCCTLLVVGFTMKYGEERITDRQYGKVMCFDAELEYAPGTPGTEEELAGVLDDMGISSIKVRKTANAYTWKDELSGVNLVCAEPDSLPGYWNLTDVKTKKELRLPEHGVVITKRMHENFGMDAGDTITLFDSNMFPHEAVISGVYNNHFGRTVFASPEAYREIFGEAAEPNCFYVRLNGQEASALNAAVREVDGFLILTDAAKDRAQIEQIAKALNALILVMIVVAGLMAFFILFNLSGSYMIHKESELTVMRINGFTTKEARNYASTELIITSLAGIFLGLPVGALLGYLIVRLTEQSDLQMVRSIDARSMIFSALITALFAAFINGMALRKIKNLKLSDLA